MDLTTLTPEMHCGYHSINMEKGGGCYFNTVGKFTSAPLAQGLTPREGEALGTGEWRGGGKGRGAHSPVLRDIVPREWGVAWRKALHT